jgi:hypothetical protein
MNMLRSIYNESRTTVNDSDSQGSASEPSDIIIPNSNETLFADDPTLQKRYLAEKDKGSNVETYTSPSWTGLPMGFKTVENGFHTIVLHRQKMKDVETDFMKAHLAACEYAHEHALEPSSLQFIILLSIKEPKKRSERMEALRELKTRIGGKYFPLAERIDFGLEA